MAGTTRSRGRDKAAPSAPVKKATRVKKATAAKATKTAAAAVKGSKKASSAAASLPNEVAQVKQAPETASPSATTTTGSLRVTIEACKQ